MSAALSFTIPFLAVVAGSLLWARENGHSPIKVVPVWIGFVVLGVAVYLLDQQLTGVPSYADSLDREAILATLAGWIIVAIVAGLCFVFVLRMLMKHQSQKTRQLLKPTENV